MINEEPQSYMEFFIDGIPITLKRLCAPCARARTVEISFLLDGVNVTSVSIQFFEVTKYTDEGFFEISSYWVANPLYDILVRVQ